MRIMKLLGCGFWVVLVGLLGCSSLHVEVAPTVDWNAVATVALSEPSRDPWLLAPEIRAELQQLGFRVVEEGADPDLRVRFFFQESPDLDANGNLSTRLQSLHLQFVDPATEGVVTVVDYFYAETLAAEQGVAAAFAGLREEMRKSPAPAVAVSAPAAVSSAVSPIPEPVSTRAPVVQAEPTLKQESVPATKVIPPPDAVDRTPAGEVPTTTLVPVTDKSKVQTIETKTESPWVPKFESWGFENWGKQREDGY